jgi:hypothetical protein
MQYDNNDNGLGWVAAAITAATTVASWIVGSVKAKKAAKAAQAAAAEQNKINAFATLDNQYTAEANATNTRALIFGAVGIIGAYLLLKDDK